MLRMNASWKAADLTMRFSMLCGPICQGVKKALLAKSVMELAV
jgi:hypothetical protein